MRGVAPLLVGVVPFALIAGASAAQADISLAAWLAMNVGVFAGAAQLALIDLWANAAPAAVMVFTAVIINLRFLLYSRALVEPLANARGRGWLAYLLTDQVFAVTMSQLDAVPSDGRGQARRALYLGAALPLWITWQVTAGLGHAYGASLPASWNLGFAVPLTFVAMLVPVARKSRAAAWAAGVGGLVALVASGVPLHAGLLCGALLGIFAGVRAAESIRAAAPREEAS